MLVHAKKIAVVEDDPLAAKMCTKFLTDLGHKAVVFENGKVFIEGLNELKPEIIFLDYMMDVMDGPETLKWLRNNPLFEHMPVFFLTSKSDRESILKISSLHVSEYLVKPINLTVLQHKLRPFVIEPETEDIHLMLSNLRFPDTTLGYSSGLQELRQQYRFYTLNFQDISTCFALDMKVQPSDLRDAPKSELQKFIKIFAKTSGGWNPIWQV